MPRFEFTSFATAFLDQLRDPFVFGAFCLGMALIVILLLRQMRQADKRRYIQWEKDAVTRDAADRADRERPATVFHAVKPGHTGKVA